eukprot:g5466.t1
MLGRKKAGVGPKPRGVGVAGSARQNAEKESKKSSWRDDLKQDDDHDVQLTERELEEFRQQTEKEEREERLKRSMELLKEEENKKSSSRRNQKKKKKKKAFAWMDSDDEASSDIGGAAAGADALESKNSRQAESGDDMDESSEDDEEAEDGENKRTSREHLYKTRICQKWQNGRCQWGNNCHYAHGASELRAPMPTPVGGSNLGSTLGGSSSSSTSTSTSTVGTSGVGLDGRTYYNNAIAGGASTGGSNPNLVNLNTTSGLRCVWRVHPASSAQQFTDAHCEREEQRSTPEKKKKSLAFEIPITAKGEYSNRAAGGSSCAGSGS